MNNKSKKIISIIIILTLLLVMTIAPVFAEISIYLEVDNVLYQTPGTIQGYKVTDWRILNYNGSQVTWDLEGYYEYSYYASLCYNAYERFRCDTEGRFKFLHTGYTWTEANPTHTLDTDLEDEWSYPCGTPGAIKNAGKVNNSGNLYGNIVFHFFVIEGGDDDDVTDVIDWFVDNDVAMEPLSPDASIEAYRNLKIQIAFNNRIRPFMFSNIEGYDFNFKLRVSEGNDSIHFVTSIEPNEKNWGVLAQYIDYHTITTETRTYTSYQYYHPVTNSSGTIITGQNISLKVYQFDMVFIPNYDYIINWEFLAQQYVYCSYSVNDNYNYVNYFSNRCQDYYNGIINADQLTTYRNSCLLKYTTNSTQYNNINLLYTNCFPHYFSSYDPNSSLSDIVQSLDDTLLVAQNYAGNYFGSGGIFYNIFTSNIVYTLIAVSLPVIATGYLLFGKRIH